MNYGGIHNCDIANGPGTRVSLFVSGCRHHCKGCFNPDTWDFNYGKKFDDATLSEILDACDHEYISGLTILGGEPMEPENQPEVLKILIAFRKRFGKAKTVWLYSGTTLEEIRNPESSYNVESCTQEILSLCDVIVDGPFVEELKDISLDFRGSQNQRIIELHK